MTVRPLLKALLTLIIYISVSSVFGQHAMQIEAVLDAEKNTITIKQRIDYQNNSDESLSALYFNDWTSSYSSPTTPLAKRFIEEFDNALLSVKPKDRGFTEITAIQNSAGNSIDYNYLENQPDIFKVTLENELLPNTSTTLHFEYTLQIQSDRFTGYGVTKDGDFNLKYWYFSPAVYEHSEWKLYSNKNIQDYYTPESSIDISMNVPEFYDVASELNLRSTQTKEQKNTFNFTGEKRTDSRLYISKTPFFRFNVQNLNIITDSNETKISALKQIDIFKKIVSFLDSELAVYSQDNLLITNTDLNKYPIYGLNIIPDFLAPFSKQFKYELNLLKNLTRLYLKRHLKINPRESYWLQAGFENFMLMKYVEQFYTDESLIGKLSNVWGIKSYNLAKLKFNDQYPLTYLHMVRTGRDQALNTPKDELLKFNANLSSKYKAALGLLYLEDIIEDSKVEEWIKELVNTPTQELLTTARFKTYLKTKTSKDIDWFFDSYLTNSQQIDYKITDVETTKDSIYFTVKNKKKGQRPISLFMLKDGKVISKQWLTEIGAKKQFVVPNIQADKLVLNYDKKVPEFDLRNNWKSISGNSLFNKPFQIRFFKDVESPHDNQLYFLPIVEFKNIYDGLNLGMNVNNKGVLNKPFLFGITPIYSVTSNALTGGAKVRYNTFFEDQNLYNINFGMAITHASFAENAFVTKTVPYVNFNFRDASNLRSNELKSLSFRYVGIEKDFVKIEDDEAVAPPYKVFNIRYIDANNGFKKYHKWFLDAQFSDQFGKLSFNYEIRRRSNKNQFYNVRVYAGAFLYSKIPTGEKNFDFALDRPTDYLFDYNYLGQFESTGIFSQQLIIAEGGFKSKLDTAFANEWLTSLNASVSIWKYIQAYGDVGVLKNKGNDPIFVYDAGIRLNLITDYFEIYFPFYSNLGWEIDQPQYSQKIRFVFTAEPKALLGLFRREWF
ncbi:metalloprotease [Formosa sp. Hel1_33_131]|uniref:metalloprotease n=1 Tax=Formosa sp. Hel1_33_131 TaxID=1336794 RepID=UPI0012F99B94|nr:metalloprotease [Formosa sp. Hel1_33_131]